MQLHYLFPERLDFLNHMKGKKLLKLINHEKNWKSISKHPKKLNLIRCLYNFPQVNVWLLFIQNAWMTCFYIDFSRKKVKPVCATSSVCKKKFQMLFEQNIASNVTRNVTLKYEKAHPSTPKHSEQLLGTYRNLLNL